MPQKPNIHGLKLQPCCVEALKEINEKIRTARQLRMALVAGPFASMLGTNPSAALFTVLSTDWDGLVKANKVIDPILRNRCHTIAQLHSFDHPGGDLNRFWTALADSFS